MGFFITKYFLAQFLNTFSYRILATYTAPKIRTVHRRTLRLHNRRLVRRGIGGQLCYTTQNKSFSDLRHVRRKTTFGAIGTCRQILYAYRVAMFGFVSRFRLSLRNPLRRTGRVARLNKPCQTQFLTIHPTTLPPRRLTWRSAGRFAKRKTQSFARRMERCRQLFRPVRRLRKPRRFATQCPPCARCTCGKRKRFCWAKTADPLQCRYTFPITEPFAANRVTGVNGGIWRILFYIPCVSTIDTRPKRSISALATPFSNSTKSCPFGFSVGTIQKQFPANGIGTNS